MGVADVDSIREMSSESFEGWIAWKSLCRSDGWIQTGVICSTFHNEMEQLREIVVMALGGKYKPHYVTPEDYLPGHKPRKRQGTLTGRAMDQALRMMCR